jgi:PAS domain S-box-containing protein
MQTTIDDPNPGAQAAARFDPHPAAPDAPRQKILIVDDKKENLLALRQILEGVDVDIVEATGGNQALAATLDHRFALAILDVMMPEMDGYELAGHLRGDAKTQNIPIIFLTAIYSEKDRIFKGYQAGAVDYIVKPYSPIVLLAKVRIFLDLDRAHENLAGKIAALTVSEERYKSLVSTIPDIVYRVDKKGRFTFLNASIFSLGYTEEELLGAHFSKILTPADAEKACRKWALPKYSGRRTGQDGQPKLFDERRTGKRKTVGLEVHLVPSQGSGAMADEQRSDETKAVIAEVNSSGIYAGIRGGKRTAFLCTVGVFRDITERKRLDQELTRYREKLEDLVQEQVNEIKCLYAISSLGVELFECIDKMLEKAVVLIPSGFRNPEKTRARIQFDDRTFATEGFKEKTRLMSADIVIEGDIIGRLDVCRLEQRPAKAPGLFVKEEQDLIAGIARLLGQSAAHIRSVFRERHLTAVLQGIRNVNRAVISEQDPHRLIQRVCKGLVRDRGYKGVWIVLTDDDSNSLAVAQCGFDDKVFSELVSFFQNKDLPACVRRSKIEPVNLLYPCSRLDSTDCSLSSQCNKDFQVLIVLAYKEKRFGYMGLKSSSSFEGDEEEISLIEELSSDIAFGLYNMDLAKERMRTKKERENLQKQLAQVQQMEAIGNLAGGIAHDFNNILSAVIGYTELALDSVAKGSLIKDHLQEVYAAGKRAKELVGQILTFARKSDKAFKPIRVDLVVKEVLKLIRSSLPTTIEIKQNIASQSLVMGNATQMHQIVMNLCTNASHAMEDRCGVIKVSLRDIVIKSEKKGKPLGLRAGSYVEFTISDTGAGISPDIIDSIFEPYFTTKRPGEGTGMGLALVHGIVESCRGKITVDSLLGKGTTLRIFLPITKNATADGLSTSEALPCGTERILFIDDEIQITKMWDQLLERLGYVVTTRNSSLEALGLFRSNAGDFDLVITDMTMPNMTGDELAIELMKIRPDIPVILCTGYSKKISEKTALEMGIKAFAYKPIAKMDLTKTVRKVLDGAKSNHPKMDGSCKV